MIIIKLMGGLGNQLQQYALYCKFNKIGVSARLDTSWFNNNIQENMAARRSVEIDRFTGVSYRTCNNVEKRKVLGWYPGILGKIIPSLNRKYVESDMYDEQLLSLENKYLEGYFACEYYYKDIIPELRKMLVLPPKESGDMLKYKSLVDEIKACNSISLHLRRGDYLDEINMQMFGNICTDEYYDDAIKYVLDKGDPRNSDLGTTSAIKTRIYIFSDDSEYANLYAANIRSKYGVDTNVVDINKGNDSCYDIELMSLCKHNICANSTFSFWGARLNPSYEKIIVRPTIQKNSQTFDYGVMKKLWEGWVFVSPDGKVYE